MSNGTNDDQMFVHVPPGPDRETVRRALAEVKGLKRHKVWPCLWEGYQWTVPLGEGSDLNPKLVAGALTSALGVDVATNQQLEDRDAAADLLW